MAFALDRSPISEETKKIAEEELRETSEIVEQALKELRELLANDDSIYFADDDETLIIFLRPCKFYAKSAYELVSMITSNAYEVTIIHQGFFCALGHVTIPVLSIRLAFR